ncbi:DUF1120 domain-containing protein [Serratia oryzae]|uniref:DUF1120 domain-containing protein n=1 Tax=Serratia oryzae TaxID=2034155 RepID=A0A1S8CDM0_9GAMM|nr:DUF1120 domain-containing protein [Serratia oryzae]OMQ18519.1 hypothetical protein BMI79_21870 [Serratia oryzae]
MRKLLTFTPAALLLLTVSGAVHAADANLTIKGTILPAACTPSISNGGVIDYGSIDSNSLNVNKVTNLQTMPLTISIACTSPIKVGFKVADNRPGTHNETGPRFGLNTDNSGNNIGYYFLAPEQESFRIDGEAGRLASVNGATYQEASIIGPNGLTYTASLISKPSGPITELPFATNMIFDVGIRTTIYPKNNLDLANEINLDGSATLSVVYL